MRYEEQWDEDKEACRGGCGRTSRSRFGTDGWCDDCAAIPAIIERAMIEGKAGARLAHRQIQLQTVALLRREADRLEREIEG